MKNLFLINSIAGAVLLLIFSCSSQRMNQKCGVVKKVHKFFDPQIKQYVYIKHYGLDQKIWYKDSLVIEQIMGLYIDEKKGVEQRREELLYYTFIDLRTMSFYNYASFSDTAEIIKQFSQEDTALVPGGWNFYTTMNKMPVTKPLEIMPDTLIEMIRYKRAKAVCDSIIVNLIENGNIVPRKVAHIEILYARCDKKGTLFQFRRTEGKKIGCPITRMDELPSEAMQRGTTSSQIEFVADKLTDKELKVFDAWERNAKMNPVQKQ